MRGTEKTSISNKRGMRTLLDVLGDDATLLLGPPQWWAVLAS